MRYDVVHRTTYVYEEEVGASYGLTHLLPRPSRHQRVLTSALDIDPLPGDRHRHHDLHGNLAEWFAIHEPHTRLEVTARSTVEVDARDLGLDAIGSPTCAAVADAARTAGRGTREDPGDPDLVQFVLPSPSVPRDPGLDELAGATLAPDRPALAAVRELASHVHEAFEFLPGATTVTTTVPEVLRKRQGVCQDFAHVMIGACRSVGLPARYVSGYLETDPPPGKPRLQGADVSHAWVAVWLPELGWVDVDPTNDQLVGERYVTTAWGRDYRDVTPLKGVIFTDGGTDELTVTVDVVRRPDA